MKFLLSLILTAALSYGLERFFPWYSVAAASFIIAYLINIRGIASFIAGALGVGLLWLGYAWMIDYNTHSILSDKMAGIFGLTDSVYMLIVTFLIGFFVGGFSALSGQSLRNAFSKKKRKTGYYL
jgi:MFS-type transporter involved in bile tolerance (Atg22 family)